LQKSNIRENYGRANGNARGKALALTGNNPEGPPAAAAGIYWFRRETMEFVELSGHKKHGI
jgi:hypothetical protein